MSQDFFGYKRNINSKEILSSDFALITIGGGSRMGLVQSAQASYQQRVEPRFEAGSSDLYWVNGQPSGTIAFSRLVGKRGLFADVNRTGCGELQTLAISLAGDHCNVNVESSANNRVLFDGAILQSVSISFQTGGLDIQDSLNYLVASMNA